MGQPYAIALLDNEIILVFCNSRTYCSILPEVINNIINTRTTDDQSAFKETLMLHYWFMQQ